MMSEHDLADVVQIAVEDLSPDHPGTELWDIVLENHVVTDEDEPALKRQRLEINCQDPSIKSFLYSINQTICLRLDSIEAKLQALEATCKSLEEKLDLVTNKQHSPIQVPMVAGSPLGATQTCNKVRDYPNGTWLGDENNPEMRVRCAIIPSDMLHISTNCRTAEKMALTLLDYLFHREVQAVSNLSGQGKHGKKQLDPLTIYGIRCHLFYKFGITESDWYRIKQSIDSKCRTAWRRKQRGQSLAVKSFSRRTPNSSSYCPSEPMMSTPPPASELPQPQPQPQALHYALANAQQVQIHQIGEDGQVQVLLEATRIPCLLAPSVFKASSGQVLQGAQLIAVASSDPAAAGVDGSPLQGSDIQVQYVQLAPVSDHTAGAQTAEALQPTLQPEMQLEHGAIQIQ
uniref:Protein BANP n=1 Tax=Gorilla gorilla gorilla TaxID=9595 RepID=G3QFQ4_GORGO